MEKNHRQDLDRLAEKYQRQIALMRDLFSNSVGHSIAVQVKFDEEEEQQQQQQPHQHNMNPKKQKFEVETGKKKKNKSQTIQSLKNDENLRIEDEYENIQYNNQILFPPPLNTFEKKFKFRQKSAKTRQNPISVPCTPVNNKSKLVVPHTTTAAYKKQVTQQNKVDYLKAIEESGIHKVCNEEPEKSLEQTDCITLNTNSNNSFQDRQDNDILKDTRLSYFRNSDNQRRSYFNINSNSILQKNFPVSNNSLSCTPNNKIQIQVPHTTQALYKRQVAQNGSVHNTTAQKNLQDSKNFIFSDNIVQQQIDIYNFKPNEFFAGQQQLQQYRNINSNENCSNQRALIFDNKNTSINNQSSNFDSFQQNLQSVFEFQENDDLQNNETISQQPQFFNEKENFENQSKLFNQESVGEINNLNFPKWPLNQIQFNDFLKQLEQISPNYKQTKEIQFRENDIVEGFTQNAAKRNMSNILCCPSPFKQNHEKK